VAAWYSYEAEHRQLDSEPLEKLMTTERAGRSFQDEPASHGRPVISWLMTTNQPAVGSWRVDTFATCSAAGEHIGPLGRPARS
jgi:hypothetical protein